MGRVRLSLSLLAGLGVWLICASPAAAQTNGWTVCNKTSMVVETAAGRAEGAGVIVDGWTKVRPGDCETVLDGPLRRGVHYLYGRSSDAHRGGVRNWAGDQFLCVDTTGSFSVESPPDCAAMGLEARPFQPVLIERSSWRTELTETADYSLDRARAAGIQRLLEDAGVFSVKIDGYLGRRTRAAIAEFLEQQAVPEETADQDLIDLLEQVSIDRARTVGLTLCNRTPHRIWSAFARLKGENWESRGWWLLESGGCARVIDEPLLQTQHFVYGEYDGEEALYGLARGSDAFCVSRAKFAITGRDDCEAAAYRTALFAATSATEDGKLIHEFFERDFAKIEDAE